MSAFLVNAIIDCWWTWWILVQSWFFGSEIEPTLCCFSAKHFEGTKPKLWIAFLKYSFVQQKEKIFSCFAYWGQEWKLSGNENEDPRAGHWNQSSVFQTWFMQQNVFLGSAEQHKHQETEYRDQILIGRRCGGVNFLGWVGWHMPA